MNEVKLNDQLLSNQLGQGFTVLCFDTTRSQQIKDVRTKDDFLSVLCLPYPSAVGEKFSANAHSAFLIRPDMHIAGCWFEATAHDVIDGYHRVTFRKGATP